MTTHQILISLAVVFCGAFVQGTAAFGFGLFVIPLLLMAGLTMPVVLAIAAVCTAVQSLTGVHHLRSEVPWKKVAFAASVRAVSLLLGIWVLRSMVALPVREIRFWLGAIILFFVLLQGMWQPVPRKRLHQGWDVAAFLVSGFVGGLCGMGGPPLVLWVMAHDWSSGRTRAFLFASFVLLVPVQLAVMTFTFGREVLHGALLGAALSPAVFFGALLGLRVGSRFSKRVLKRVAFLLLLAIAVNAMLPQLMHFFRELK